MLSTLRHKGVSKKVLWFITIIIVLSFGLFGVASRLDHTFGGAGKIYGQSVSLRDYQRAYLDSRDQALILYGDQFAKVGAQIDMEGEAWDRLILLREAKKRHITVSDKEVVDAIAALPFFQREGRFDPILYDEIVRNPEAFGRKPHEFEEGMRGRLMIKKMLDGVVGPLVITDEEIKAEYTKRNEKIKLDYITINPADFNTGLTATPAEAKQYFDQNKDAFRQPATINVQYVSITIPTKATAEQKDKIKKDAQAFARTLAPSADFAAMAKKAGYEAKDSGPFTKEAPLLTFAWSPELVDKLFTMKKGETTSLLEMPDGLEIARVKEVKDTNVPDFETIKDTVQKAVIEQKAYAKAQVKADQVLKAIKDGIAAGKDLKAVAQEMKLTVQQTPEFSRGEYNPSLGFAEQLQQASLNLTDKERLTGIVATTQGPAIGYLASVEKIKEDDFSSDKENYRQMLTARKRNQITMVFVTKLKLEANLRSDLKGKIRRY